MHVTCFLRAWFPGQANRKGGEFIVQELQARLDFRNASELVHTSRAGTDLARWTYTILSSIWKNELRSRRIRMGQGFVDPEIALVADGIREMDTNLLARQVLQEVERLPEGQREAVFLVYGEGLSYKEAADVLEVPTGTIMSRLAAARAKLAGLRDRGDQMIPAE